MSKRITFAGGCYDRTQALLDGTVKPDGLELNWMVLRYSEIWRRMLNDYDFDASELSLSSYLIAGVGQASYRNTGISGAYFPALLYLCES